MKLNTILGVTLNVVCKVVEINSNFKCFFLGLSYFIWFYFANLLSLTFIDLAPFSGTVYFFSE